MGGMGKRSEYIVAILINIVLLYIFNSALTWNLPFITERFVLVLPIFNLSFTASIAANLIFLFYDEYRFLESIRMILNVIGVAVLYMLYMVFPFDFTAWPSPDFFALVVRFALIIGIIVSVGAVVIQIFRIISGRPPLENTW
jgi:hypothetical protein